MLAAVTLRNAGAAGGAFMIVIRPQVAVSNLFLLGFGMPGMSGFNGLLCLGFSRFM